MSCVVGEALDSWKRRQVHFEDRVSAFYGNVKPTCARQNVPAAGTPFRDKRKGPDRSSCDLWNTKLKLLLGWYCLPDYGDNSLNQILFLRRTSLARRKCTSRPARLLN